MGKWVEKKRPAGSTTRLAASFLNATNSDLSGLKARNGKLIIWHGWADPALPAQGTIDYYNRVLAHDGQARDEDRQTP